MNIIQKIKTQKLDYKSIVLLLSSKGLLKWLPDKAFLKLRFYCETGYKLNLKNPQSFNEKIQWLKLYDRRQEYIKYVDKIEVRGLIKKKLGEEYLIPMLGIYNSINEINFENLPDRFVLKCTHDSGGVIICKDKNNFDIKGAKKKLKKFLNKNFYYYGREWPYKNVKPRIICEELIQTENSNPPRDYKIFCFKGDPKFAFVASDRGQNTKFDFFDVNWNRQPLAQHYPTSDYFLEKPKQWEKMLELAKILSKDLTHVRVDFYIDKYEKIFFGELTFYHFSGFEKFEPESYDLLLGSWIDLSVLGQ